MSSAAKPKGSILIELIRWMLQRSILLTMAAMVVTVGSALGVIYVTHVNRQLYSQLQNLQNQQDLLASEYEKLLLEQSAWSEYSRVEKLSRLHLEMKIPTAADVIMVQYGK